MIFDRSQLSANLAISQFGNLAIWQCRKSAKICQTWRGSFSAGSRLNFATKYATCSSCRKLPAPPAFAPLRVEKFSKRSAKKSTASPKFQQILTETCNLAGARSRLYRSQILQVNMRWKALAEIYAMPAFAPWKCMDSFEKRPRAARKIFQFFSKI